ncbi:MAG: GDP-mannose 4,6-dehydratase [Candidatus Kariarchaeaceae archaeon]|jgi:nucleoside-diphosphate-sugar epimerase
MSNVVITGVGGFIGSHLGERLVKNGHHVFGIDNFDPFYAKTYKERNLEYLYQHNNFHFYEIDTQTEDFMLALSNLDIDVIVHLSARAGVRPSLLFPQSYINHDIVATVNILETARKLDINNFIFGSSSSVYGNLPDLPYHEAMNLDKPISPYAAAKLSCELFNYVFHSQYKMNITNLRFFTVYGPRQRPEMGIHKFARLISQGKPVEMYGDGSSSRDYTYVDDIIDGVVGAINSVKGYHTYNLGNNKSVLLKDLISKIEEALGKEANIIRKEIQPGDVDHTLADITKAQNELGYNPTTTIEEGIKKFINWFNEQNGYK